MDNPRYTGYAFFSRWAKHETLLDPDDVAASHVIRFRRASSKRVVRSRQPAHPAIVSVEIFTQAQPALAASQGGVGGTSDARDGIKTRLTKAEVRLRRLQAAMEAGVDPAAVVEGINEAQAERAAAKAELENTSVPDVLSDAEIYAMIDSLGDVGAALAEAKPTSLSCLYQQLRLQLRYDPQDQAVFVTAQPRVGNARVRGGT